jgi:hypothetical protein
MLPLAEWPNLATVCRIVGTKGSGGMADLLLNSRPLGVTRRPATLAVSVRRRLADSQSGPKDLVGLWRRGITMRQHKGQNCPHTFVSSANDDGCHARYVRRPLFPTGGSTVSILAPACRGLFFSQADRGRAARLSTRGALYWPQRRQSQAAHSQSIQAHIRLCPGCSACQ